MVGEGGCKDLLGHVGSAEKGKIIAGPMTNASANGFELAVIQGSSGHVSKHRRQWDAKVSDKV